MDIALKTISAEQVTSEIISLFDITKPTMPRALQVLEGINRGQILVDDIRQPTSAVVRESMYGTLYFGGSVGKPQIAALVNHFRAMGEVGIGCWLDDPMNEIIPSDFNYDGRTYFFTERFRETRELNLQLPEGYRLLPRDKHLFTKSFDYQSTLDLFGSVANVLKYTRGTLILHGDTLVCEAATGAPTQGWIEVGVTTAETDRRRGFATLACTHLIATCEAQGYRTWWDCAKQNTPSLRLAKRLGYQNEPEYRYVWWAKK